MRSNSTEDHQVTNHEGIHHEGAVYACTGREEFEEETRYGVYVASPVTQQALALMILRGTAPSLDEKIGETQILRLLVDSAPLSRSGRPIEEVANAMEAMLTTIREHAAPNTSAAE